QAEAAAEMVGGRRRDWPRLDDDGRLDLLEGQQAPRGHAAAADGDPDRGVASGSTEAIGLEEISNAGGDPRLGVRRELDVEADGGSPETVEVLVELGRAAAARAQRLEHPVAELKAAIERGKVFRVGGEQRVVDPDVPAGEGGPSVSSRSFAHATSRAPIADSGPRALATVSSHSA